MCPKTINELKSAQRNVVKVGGKKVNFEPIVQQIVSSKLFYTVNEVHTDFVKKRVTRFRTMKLLNKAVEDKKLERLYDEGKFFYGAPTAPTKA